MPAHRRGLQEGRGRRRAERRLRARVQGRGDTPEDPLSLQFIHRIIKSEKAGPPATTTYLDAAVTSTAAGGYRLTTDPTKPFYNTDSAKTTNPFYYAGGVSLRDPTKGTMLDAPAPRTDFVATAFRGGADKVVSYARFNTYLVRDMDVLYRIDITQRWEFDKATHWDDADQDGQEHPRRRIGRHRRHRGDRARQGAPGPSSWRSTRTSTTCREPVRPHPRRGRAEPWARSCCSPSRVTRGCSARPRPAPTAAGRSRRPSPSRTTRRCS